MVVSLFYPLFIVYILSWYVERRPEDTVPNDTNKKYLHGKATHLGMYVMFVCIRACNFCIHYMIGRMY